MLCLFLSTKPLITPWDYLTRKFGQIFYISTNTHTFIWCGLMRSQCEILDKLHAPTAWRKWTKTHQSSSVQLLWCSIWNTIPSLGCSHRFSNNLAPDFHIWSMPGKTNSRIISIWNWDSTDPRNRTAAFVAVISPEMKNDWNILRYDCLDCLCRGAYSEQDVFGRLKQAHTNCPTNKIELLRGFRCCLSILIWA